MLLEKLENSLTNFNKSTVNYVDIPITTLFWKDQNLIIDVLTYENECVVTHGKNVSVYSFDSNDIDEVVTAIVSQVTEICKPVTG